jgi:hypothetical protein
MERGLFALFRQCLAQVVRLLASMRFLGPQFWYFSFGDKGPNSTLRPYRWTERGRAGGVWNLGT